MKKKYVTRFANISNDLYELCSQKDTTRRKCLNLGKMECNLLFRLANVDEPQCMADLAHSLGVSHSRITRIVDNLVYYKYVRRFPSSRDRRSWLAELTPEGVKANDESVNEFLDIQLSILDELPEEKIETIIDSVSLYFESFKKALAQKEGEK